MIWFQRYSSVVLYTTYIVSVLLMLACIFIYVHYAHSLKASSDTPVHDDYTRDHSWAFFGFFGTANAMVIFRVFGLNLLTSVVHALLTLVVVVWLIWRVFIDSEEPSFTSVFSKPTYILLFFYILQCLLALHLVVFRPGRTKKQRRRRSGLHAFIGLLTFIVLAWNYLLTIGMLCANPDHIAGECVKSVDDFLVQPPIIVALALLYLLAIMFILLTPFFEQTSKKRKRKSSTTGKKRPSNNAKQPSRKST